MKTRFGHLTFCTNIYSGEEWSEHFDILKNCVPIVKKEISANQKFGLGLRLANKASIELMDENKFNLFKKWLDDNDLYVFTMNGFPYGSFHHQVVKDNVHSPDWTKESRLEYTIRLFHLLSKMLPEDVKEGGISTSPLSYRHWWDTEEASLNAKISSAQNILKLIDELALLHEKTTKVLHLDIEPEPDGLLENSTEFLNWYTNILLPLGREYFNKKGLTFLQSEELIKRHVQLCYDVCHFSIEYENPETVLESLKKEKIKIGKIQLSSALKIDFSNDSQLKIEEIKKFEEPTYLHQVVAKMKNGDLNKYSDLPEALTKFNEDVLEWRVHFHVPIFLQNYGRLNSTQSDISFLLEIHKSQSISQHLEIETYTWDVLPNELKKDMSQSIIRELNWVKEVLEEK